MRTRRPTPARALLLLPALALCAACSTPAPEPERVSVILEPPAEQRVDPPEFKYEWGALDRDERGDPEPYLLAQWVTERHNRALHLLKLEPPARTQALELLEEVLRRVPDNSRVRLLLAHARFGLAAYWFRAADRVAWEVQRMQVERTARPERSGDPGRTLTDEELKALEKEAQPKLEAAKKALEREALAALKHYERYLTQRPDQRLEIVDFIWKLQFYLQDYRQALQLLDYQLAQWEAREIDRQDPLVVNYSFIRDRIQSYLAELRIEGVEGKRRGGPLALDDSKASPLREPRVPRGE